MIDGKRTAANLGLRFSWQATGLYSITGFIAFVSAFPGQNVPIPDLIVLGLLLTVAVGALIQAIAWVLKRAPRNALATSPMLFLILVAVVGLVRGIGFYYLVEIAGLPQPTPLPIRLLSSTIITLIWLTFSCVLIESTAAYSRRFSNLFRQTTMKVALDKAPQITADANIDSLENLVALKRNLKGILEQASSQGVTSDALLAAGAAVRTQIEELIRPLSHRLWFNEKRNRTEIRLLGLVGDSLSHFTFLTPRFLATWAALEFAAVVNAYPLPRVLFGVGLSLVLLGLVISGYRLLPRATIERLGSTLTVAFIAFTALVPVTVADLLMPLFGQEHMLIPLNAATVVSPIALATLLIVESCLALVEQDRKLVYDLFETQIGSGIRAKQNAFASYLHNSLQSELTGIAYQLEASAARPGDLESRDTLEKLGALINRSISEDFANFEETPMLRLERMVAAWDGIATVTALIPEDCQSDPTKLNLIVQLIEEATTNSVRHGKAKNIKVTVSRSADGLQVLVDTDSSVRRNIQSGLGSKWFEANSIAVSPLEFTPTGTRFTLTL